MKTESLPRSRRGPITAVIAVLAVMVAGMTVIWPAGQARAAVISDAITDVHVESLDGRSLSDGVVEWWESLRVTADWAVPDDAQAGDTFGMELPDLMVGVVRTFDLKSKTGEKVATCDVAEARVTCTLTNYVNNRNNVAGTLYFNAELRQEIDPRSVTEIIFDTGETTVDFDVDLADPNPFQGTTWDKDGGEFADGTIVWFVYVAGGQQGLERELTNVVFKDNLGPNQELVSMEAEVATGLDAHGSWPAYRPMDPADYSVDLAAGRVTIPLAEQGRWYRVRVISTPTGKGPYTNEATISANDVEPRTVIATAREYGMGGSGSGDNQPTPPTTTPDPGMVSRTFQVDRYRWDTRRLGRLVSRLARDRMLGYREDRALWGHSRWQMVTVRVPEDAGWRRVARAINRKSTVGNVRMRTPRFREYRRGAVTMAWELAPRATRREPWGPNNGAAQRYFGRSPKR